MIDEPLAEWAIAYVNLVLAVGRYDPDFVDAYYGPPAWKAAAEAGNPQPLAELRVEARRILGGVTVAKAMAGEEVRRDYLLGQVAAVEAHLARLEGRGEHPCTRDARNTALRGELKGKGKTGTNR